TAEKLRDAVAAFEKAHGGTAFVKDKADDIAAFKSRIAGALEKSGLIAEIFNIGHPIGDFPNIPSDKKPDMKKVDKTIDVDVGLGKWPGTDLLDFFYIRWTGIIRIPKDGKYRFFVESDDGTRLYIDGKLVANNPGVRPMRKRGTEELDLKAGDHQIKIEFFENTAHAGCRFLWSGEDFKETVVPESVLFHRGEDD
ncbi:MAG: PA14 domain-containing protein, partial [Planctomycetota bacterium]|nr:PA14 domain-containing protein [Planctomycetota bacterium]